MKNMIKSMTGYGKAEAALGKGKLTIEIRTLNGKNADISIKTSLFPKEKELAIRKKLSERLVRGTIDLFATWEPHAGSSARTINKEVASEYFRQIKSLTDGLGINAEGLDNAVIASILRFPDIMDSSSANAAALDEKDWPEIEKALDSAIDMVNDYRTREGAALYADVTSRVRNILALYDEVESFEGERIDAVKAKILKNLEELGQKYDQSRFEQEMVYYIEKLDINEEKVRLRQHCRYFMDTIESEEYPGRKLGFIIQEMGREINTTGSKANHAGIQKTVVKMKDEREKMREQSMNIL